MRSSIGRKDGRVLPHESGEVNDWMATKLLWVGADRLFWKGTPGGHVPCVENGWVSCQAFVQRESSCCVPAFEGRKCHRRSRPCSRQGHCHRRLGQGVAGRHRSPDGRGAGHRGVNRNLPAARAGGRQFRKPRDPPSRRHHLALEKIAEGAPSATRARPRWLVDEAAPILSSATDDVQRGTRRNRGEDTLGVRGVRLSRTVGTWGPGGAYVGSGRGVPWGPVAGTVGLPAGVRGVRL